MCTSVNARASKVFWDSRSPRKDKKFDYFYKIYLIDDNGNLRSPYFHKAVTWGEIVSNRKSKKLGIENKDTESYNFGCYYVSHGIHVIASQGVLNFWLADIECYLKKRYNDKVVVVKVRCYKEDFVGCDIKGNAVFMKVHLSRAEYRKAIKCGKQL